MISVLTLTGPIYLAIGLGYVATRRQVFSQADGQVLGRFVLQFALPAMIFSTLAQRDFEDVFHPDYLLAYALGSLVAMGLGLLWAGALGRRGMTSGAVMGMGQSCSNSGYIGYPILLQVLGPSAGVGMALTLLVENMLMIPLCLALMQSGQARDQSFLRSLGASLWGMRKMPLIWAIVLGFLASVAGWHPPEILARTIQMFAGAAAAAALFVNGGALVGLKLEGLLKPVAGVALGKLVVHPLGVGLALWWLGVAEPELFVSGIVLAAMPMLGIYPLLAQRAGQGSFSAAALLGTTIASFASINLILWGLSHGGWI